MSERKPEFMMCNHSVLPSLYWGTEPTRTIGSCPVHSYSCPKCGFGVGCAPPCKCSVVVEDKPEPMFGTHIKEAYAIIKDILRESRPAAAPLDPAGKK